MATSTKQTVTILLDGKPLVWRDKAPSTTLLNALRDDWGRKGTKEGCAEGDCGACTVVVADLHQDEVRYRAVNACIQLLPTLDGKALFTVESLKTADRLHPVQQAMVDCHASQCGFCTPGFVMSLFALYQNNTAPNREQVCTALSGNLCRCTGYRPIIDAALSMHRYPPAPVPDPSILKSALTSLQADTASLVIRHGEQSFFAPRSLDELADCLLTYPDACLLAGGTDVGLWITKQHRDLNALIYLGQISELDYVESSQSCIDIGAAVSLEMAYAALVQHYPELQELYERFASLPIRNAGTLVGNVANGSPIGDSMPALISLGASVILRRGAIEREVPLDQFYLGYQQKDLQAGEFIKAVRIPLPPPDVQFRTYKISKRFEQDISAVCAAFALQQQNGTVSYIRVAFGGMAATPKRATHCEAALLGQAWDETVIRQAMQALDQDFSPLTDMRASAGYRQTIARNLLYKFWLHTTGEAEENTSVLAMGART